MRQQLATTAVFVIILFIITNAKTQPAFGQIRTLDNDTLIVGIDLNRGGAINELRKSGSVASLVNIHDAGRYIQQSYYSSPIPFQPSGASLHPSYPNWPWNPVQAGDAYNTSPQLVTTSNDGTTLYVKCVPQQWALNNVDAECTMESWITLDQNRVHVRNRLVNYRSDTTRYGGIHQELPALYTIGTLYRLYTYTDSAPFTHDDLTQIFNAGPPWSYWHATENWSALVNDDDWGLGVFLPGATFTAGGFHDTPNQGGPAHNNTGYIAPLHTDILDHDIVYEFSYTLIVGDLYDDIRSYVYSQQPQQVLHHDFDQHRQHCLPVNLTDTSPPFSGFWPITLDQNDPQIICPPSLWQAADVSTVFVTAAYRTQTNTAEMFFAGEDRIFTGDKQVTFTIIPDGVVRSYAVDLASHPLYTGTMTQLRLDPLIAISPGDNIDLHAITTTSLSAANDIQPRQPSFVMAPNFPNPYNPGTKIRFNLATQAPVDLRIFDTAGRLVSSLLRSETLSPGAHEVTWTGDNDAGLPMPSGTYFFRMESRGMSQTMKTSLVR